jgi:phosphatidylglycerophosphate synthase
VQGSATEVLKIVGECNQRVFGMPPSERLNRQLAQQNEYRIKHGKPPMDVAAAASAVLDEAAISWLFAHPGEILGTPEGRALAVAVPNGEMARACRILESGGPIVPSGHSEFVRKLRRRVAVLALCVHEQPVRDVERRLYVNAYKGVTDLVTKYVWPWPAYYATRACAQLGITPNAVTFTGMLLMLLATWLFWHGEFASGLAAAWGMTFLDTVDGKLARVAARSSTFGNRLDHGTDILHPPLWWFAVTQGAAALDPGRSALLWQCFGVILIAYIISRLVEEAFKKRFGFNAFIWRPFDSYFRLIVARRNIMLLMLTVGTIVGALTESWVAAAAWNVASMLIQLIRLLAAIHRDRRETLRPWLA